MKNKEILLGSLIVAFMIGMLSLGIVSAHNIEVGAPSLEKDFKLIKTYFPKATMYKTGWNCEEAVLLNRIWDNRLILSMETYQNARHPHKEYCGIIYTRR